MAIRVYSSELIRQLHARNQELERLIQQKGDRRAELLAQAEELQREMLDELIPEAVDTGSSIVSLAGLSGISRATIHRRLPPDLEDD